MLLLFALKYYLFHYYLLLPLNWQIVSNGQHSGSRVPSLRLVNQERVRSTG